jgi:hypothetical protein
MKIRKNVPFLLAAIALSAAGLAPSKAPAKPAAAKAKKASVAAAPAAGPGLEKQIGDFVALYLPWDPDSRVTVESSPLKLPGFSAWHAVRTGRYPTLKAVAVVFI